MSEKTDQLAAAAAANDANLRPHVSPSVSRFMFVDVAAARAKQLRRGAVIRVPTTLHDSPKKLERLAMEEVRQGLIEYTIPELKKPGPPPTE
jgi:DNA-directed RNA polymerase subunit K/omega